MEPALAGHGTGSTTIAAISQRRRDARVVVLTKLMKEVKSFPRAAHGRDGLSTKDASGRPGAGRDSDGPWRRPLSSARRAADRLAERFPPPT